MVQLQKALSCGLKRLLKLKDKQVQKQTQTCGMKIQLPTTELSSIKPLNVPHI